MHVGIFSGLVGLIPGSPISRNIVLPALLRVGIGTPRHMIKHIQRVVGLVQEVKSYFTFADTL